MHKPSRREFLWFAGTTVAMGVLGGTRIARGASMATNWGTQPIDPIKRGRVELSADQLVSEERDNVIVAGGQLRLEQAGDGRCRSAIVATPLAFTAIAPSWSRITSSGSLDIALRVSADGVRWSKWQFVVPDDAAGPAGSEVRFGSLLGIYGPPLPNFAQCEITLRSAPDGTSPQLNTVTLSFADTSGGPSTAESLAADHLTPRDFEVAPAGASQTVLKPAVITRTAWGCPDGQSSPRWSPTYQSTTHLFVHHTATANAQPDWAAVVRAIWNYHTYDRGWGDIGYSFLVDPNGYLYEGRAGGDDVEAGHTYGFNSGALGLAFLGTFSTLTPPAAMLASAEAILAWKAGQRCIDPTSSRAYLAYPGCPAKTLVIPTLLGHRDAPGHGSYDACNVYGPTSCPGDGIANLLPTIRSAVNARLPSSGSSLAIESISFTPALLASGSLLRIDVRVANNGCTTVPSQGPMPGFVYNEGDSYRWLGYPEAAGSFRIGLDFRGRTSDVDRPYRWGLGGNLAPGAKVTITGYVRLSTARSTDYWVGLVEEGVRWWQDGVGTRRIIVAQTLKQATLPTVVKNR